MAVDGRPNNRRKLNGHRLEKFQDMANENQLVLSLGLHEGLASVLQARRQRGHICVNSTIEFLQVSARSGGLGGCKSGCACCFGSVDCWLGERCNRSWLRDLRAAFSSSSDRAQI